jgi:hypothetical protein
LQKIIQDNHYDISGRLLLLTINDHYTINGRDRFLPVHTVKDIKIGGKSVEELEVFWYAWNDRVKHISYADLVSDIGVPIVRDHFFTQVRQCTLMWPWVHDYDRAQPSRAHPQAGHHYSYQYLAEGVRFLIEKRNDDRNKRLMQQVPTHGHRQERDRRDRNAAPGAETDPGKKKNEDRRKQNGERAKPPARACAAYNKGKCKLGDKCPEVHDEKAKANRERNLALAATQRREQREHRERNKERGRKPTPGPGKPSKQKCWAYAEGKCTRQSCRFLHETFNADEKKAKEQWEKDLWERQGKRPSYKLTDAERKAAAPASSQPNSRSSSRAGPGGTPKGSARSSRGRSGSRDSLRSRGSSQFRARTPSAGSKGSSRPGSRGGDPKRRWKPKGRGKGKDKDRSGGPSSSRK